MCNERGEELSKDKREREERSEGRENGSTRGGTTMSLCIVDVFKAHAVPTSFGASEGEEERRGKTPLPLRFFFPAGKVRTRWLQRKQ